MYPRRHRRMNFAPVLGAVVAAAFLCPSKRHDQVPRKLEVLRQIQKAVANHGERQSRICLIQS